MSLRELHELVDSTTERNPDLREIEIARLVTQSLDVEDLHPIAIEMARLWAHQYRREGQRVTERANVSRRPVAAQIPVVARSSTTVETPARVEKPARIYEKVASVIEQYIEEIKLELTDELLEETFARGDGTQVKWGEATIEEHRVRARRLRRLAAGNAEAAARHELAIKMLEDSENVTLLELKNSTR